MKKTILFSSALVALAMLASCQKEELFETPATATGVTEFTATIGQPTKTAIDPYGKITWTEGNEITVTDAASHSAVYVAASDGDRTTFTLREDQTAVGDGPYTATYGDINKQVYDKDGANCPLTAATTDASTTDLHFSSPYAVVKVTAKSSDDDKTVKTVVVKYGNSSSILDCGGGETLTSGGVDFYVAVRPSTEEAALSVSFYTDDEMAKKKRTGGDISLAAKDLLSVTFESLTWGAQKTFKAVYDTNGGANTLTFYYDNDDHSGAGITVYEGSTDTETTKYLFDDSQTSGDKKWGYNGILTDIKSVVINESVADYPFLTSTAYMFYNMKIADSISGAQYLDVSNVTDMSSMFNQYGQDSPSLATYPDVSKWDTGNVTNMQYMFYRYGMNSQSLAACPDVSKWNTGNVTTMANMFNQYGQNSTLLAIYPEVSDWNTGEVTNMTSMFSSYGNSSAELKAVPDVSGWKTDNVTAMGNLFANYGNAKNIDCKLDLTGWNLAKLTTGNVFNNFKPKTFVVKIPAKTGNKANQPGTWYGSGTHGFGPPSSKYFIPVLTGVFTVSDGKTVYFSNSNLVATIDEHGAPTAWKFAANQYDYLGKGGANMTIGNTSTRGTEGDVDLFGWSTSNDAGTSTTDNYGIMTSTTDSDYSGNFYDWWKAYCVSKSISPDNTWRTLTTEEWQYLFSYDGSGSGGQNYENDTRRDKYKYGVTVCGKTNCVVLLPDYWVWDVNTVGTGWQTAYPETADDSHPVTWQAMEAAGAVCLPAAGGREGSSVNIGGGNYWSSTANGNSAAYYVCFSSDYVTLGNSGSRCHGLSVRLITECQ